MGQDIINLKITVTDSLGKLHLDSINLRYANYMVSKGNLIYYIHKGDKVIIYPLAWPVYPLKSITWTNTYNLSRIDGYNFHASPDTSTFYYYYIIDSLGCSIRNNAPWQIYVIPKANINNEEKNSIILNNKTQYFKNEKVLLNNYYNKIELFDIEGRLLFKDKNVNEIDLGKVKLSGSHLVLYIDNLRPISIWVSQE
jgi:hypothetical protein